MADILTTGEIARLIDRPTHQVRRTADRLWSDVPRKGRDRLISRDRLCELAAAIEARYGSGREAVTQ